VQASWAAITALNVSWAIYLWFRRRHDHPWLWRFYGISAAIDGSFFLMDSPASGGLNLFPLYAYSRPIWIALATFCWMAWYWMPALLSVKLMRERVGWRVAVPILLSVLLVSCSEILGASTMFRRQLMHYILEPILVIITMACLLVYIIRQIKLGEIPDFLAFAMAATIVPLVGKILFLLNDQLLISNRTPAHVYHYLHLGIIILMYHITPRFRRWSLFSR
jgi:hypothetical protein